MGRCYVPPVNVTSASRLHGITSVYIGVPLIIFGIVTNIICIAVWNRLMKRARNRNIACGIYLITIGVVDTGMLASFFLADTLGYLNGNITSNEAYNVFYAYIGFPFFMFFTFLSFWLIAGVDTCRLTMVFFPVKLRQRATRITNTAIFLIILFVFGVNIPDFLAYRSSHTPDGTPCRWETDLLQTKSFFNFTYYFQCVFLTVFPWTVIVIVNTVMFIRRTLVPDFTPKFKKRANEMGHVLFGISIWFVTIIFWQCVAQCFFLKTPRTSQNWQRIDTQFAIGKLGMVLNSSTKLILYVAASKTFRKAFFHLLFNPKTQYSHLSRVQQSPTITQNHLQQGRNAPRSIAERTRRKYGGRSVNSVHDLSTDLTPSKYIKVDSSTIESRRKLFMIMEDVTKIQLEEVSQTSSPRK